MVHMRKLSILLVLSLVLAISLSGCSAPQPAGLSDQQLAALTENVLKSIDANDYAAFTRDFSDPMKAAFPQTGFDEIRSMLSDASGSFVSLGTPTLSNNQGYVLYRFPAQYTDETVYVTLSFLIGGQQVEGLWFELDQPAQSLAMTARCYRSLIIDQGTIRRIS